MKDEAFIGAKVALFVGERLLVILRDVDRDIPWPGWWDIPGGGREPGESPEEVVIRETFEEVGLTLTEADLRGKRQYLSSSGKPVFFFGAHLPEGAEREICFGSEGQCWELWQVADYIAHSKGIPQFKERLANYLRDAGHHRSSLTS
ncbi:MAG: NUDIX hydrolase [Pseudomonadota bacterium]